MNILLVEDHPLFIQGLGNAILRNFPDSNILFAENGKVALMQLENNFVDLIFMDIQMPVMSGYDATFEIRKTNRKVKIIALSMFEELHYVIKMLESGINGYSHKHIGEEEIVKMIEVTMSGEFYISKELIPYMDIYLKRKAIEAGFDSQTKHLSPQELTILLLICKQFTTKEIALKLNIAERTVDHHREHIIEKTNSKNTVGLVLYAIREGHMKAY